MGAHEVSFMKTQTTEVKPQYRSKNIEQGIAHVMEECGELLAAYGKAKRWGWQSVNPELPPDQQETNQEWWMRELRDLKKAINSFEDLHITEDMSKDYSFRKWP